MSQAEGREQLVTSHERKMQELWARAGEAVEAVRDYGLPANRYAWPQETDAPGYRVHRRAHATVIQLQMELSPYYDADGEGAIDEADWTEAVATVRFDDDQLEADQRLVSLDDLEWWDMHYRRLEVPADVRGPDGPREQVYHLLLTPLAIRSVYRQEVAILHELGFATEADEDRPLRDISNL